MKIIHIALAGPVTEGLTYQENLLTKYHQRMGHEVVLICSRLMWGTNGKMCLSDQCDLKNADGVRYLRLEEKHGNPAGRMKTFPELYATLESLSPDILFIHGCQFRDVGTIVRYLKRHRTCKAFVDNHADIHNSASTRLSRSVLHKIIWRHYAQKIEPFVECFYGVLPSRIDFLQEFYGIPRDRIRLLVMGADDEEIEASEKRSAQKDLKKEYGVPEGAFVVAAGGKIDKDRNAYLDLIKAVFELNESGQNVFLLLFGSITQDVIGAYEALIKSGKNVQYIGWCNKAQLYDIHRVADIFVHPARHSVLWEENAGNAIPAIYHASNGAGHLDYGNNCLFVQDVDKESIKNAILHCMEHYGEMKSRAEAVAEHFLYSGIAKRSIEAALTQQAE